MTWVLVMYLNSVQLFTLYGFPTIAACERAGQAVTVDALHRGEATWYTCKPEGGAK